MVHFTEEEKIAFADIMRRVSIRYDNLFECSFAYAMGIHQRPLPPRKVDGVIEEDEDDIAHFHVHFEPPLLRSASVRKFMAGCVWLGTSLISTHASLVSRLWVNHNVISLQNKLQIDCETVQRFITRLLGIIRSPIHRC